MTLQPKTIIFCLNCALSNFFDYEQALGVLQRLSMMAQMNDQAELHDKIDSVFMSSFNQ